MNGTPPNPPVPGQLQPSTVAADTMSMAPGHHAQSEISGSSGGDSWTRLGKRMRVNPLVTRLEDATEDRPVRVGRYEVLGAIGMGGLGVVYRAFDIQQERMVALKTLPALEPSAVMVLKREFRTASGLSHPNLVQLYELVADGDTCYFTMELVHGEDFTAYMRGKSDGTSSSYDSGGAYAFHRQRTQEPVAPDTNGSAPTDSMNPYLHADGLPRDLERLRKALGQLVGGVRELHRNGLLHLDIKPSNVLVTPAGRVVLLDFGLVQNIARAHDGDSRKGRIAGTPGYMSPEQAAGETLTEASDWYSVGTVLFRALTGRLPFRGALLAVLARKCTEEAPKATTFVPSVPEDLDDLCAQLLDRFAGARPGGNWIARAVSCEVSSRPTVETAQVGAMLVGRELQMAQLKRGRRALVRGRTVWTEVVGCSGLGKTALVRAFLDGCRTESDTLVLDGRCYERETLPFKAIDPLIDELSSNLDGCEFDPCEALTDVETLAVVRLFPALRLIDALESRVSTLSLEAVSRVDRLDGQSLRRLAFGALKVLLRTIAQRRRLVLFIDDLQWGDADSMRLLGDLLASPAPALMVIVAYRPEDSEVAGLLDTMRQHAGALGAETTEVRVTVEPLTDAEAALMITDALGQSPAAAALRSQIVAEASGAPFFIEEYCREAQRRMRLGETSPTVSSLDELITARTDVLEADLKHLLAVICAAGQPLPREIVLAAAQYDGDTYGAFGRLAHRRLIRTTGGADAARVDVYHDRVRQAVWEGLMDSDRQVCHAGLVEALQTTTDFHDPELLARHLHGMGWTSRAIDPLLEAADMAADAMAVDRAAELHGRAVRWAQSRPNKLGERLPRLRLSHAQALGRAGRSVEAAQVFEMCALDAQTEDLRRNYTREAAGHYLCGGVWEQGLALAAPLMAEVGLSYPTTKRAAMVQAIGSFVRLRLGGTKLRGTASNERAGAPVVDKDARFRMLLCDSVGTGISNVEPIASAAISLRGLREALRLGEVAESARGLAYYGLLLVYGGSKRGVARGMAQIARAQGMAEECGEPRSIALSQIAEGVAQITTGKLVSSTQRLTAAAAMVAEKCPSATWEWSVAMSTATYVRFWTGDFDAAFESASVFYRRSLDIGDQFGVNSYPALRAVCEVARGNTASAELLTAKAWELRGHPDKFYFEDFVTLQSEVWRNLYTNEPEAALNTVTKHWDGLKKAGLLDLAMMKYYAGTLRATSALAVAMKVGRVQKKPYLKDARRWVRKVGRLKQPHMLATATLLQVCLASLSGGRAEIRDQLAIAVAQLEQTDATLHALAAKRRLGELTGGERGANLKNEADAAMASKGIRKPKRWAAMLVPLAFS